MGGGAFLYSHSVLHLPCFSSLIKPNFGKPFLPMKELADRPLVLSLRANRNGERHGKDPLVRAQNEEGLEDYPESVDGRSSLSPDKEKILALFRRIQASISKGEAVNSKKWGSKNADDKSSAKAILEVLHQSRIRGKGKTSAEKAGKSLFTRKDSLEKEERAADTPPTSAPSTRPRSSFTRKSPIPNQLSPQKEDEQEDETLPAMPTPSTPKDEMIHQETAVLPETDKGEVQDSRKFKEMNLVQLKEFAKSKGIRGYSKLKKSELVELVSKSLSNSLP